MAVDLLELEHIPGVEDSVIYSRWGELLVPHLAKPVTRLEQLGRDIALYTALLEKTPYEVDLFELIYEERHVITRISHDCLIIVVCDNTADTTLIKLRLNVIMEEVKADKDIQKMLRKSSGKKDLVAEASGEADVQELFKKMKINTGEG